MRIVFTRHLLQRYRAVLHLVDPIIESGHKLIICVKRGKFNRSKLREIPSSTGSGTKDSLKFLIEHYGISLKHFDKIKFTSKKNHKADLRLVVGKHKAKEPFISIPYVKPFIVKPGKAPRIITGNPLCELFRDCQKNVEEVKDSVLVIHPGGSRGFVSPVKQNYGHASIRKNNTAFLKRVMDNLPEWCKIVTIKTHPFPYHQCTRQAIETYNLPELKRMFPGLRITVADMNLIDLMCSHDWIINFGSSTAFWLTGSPKKWINVTGLAKFKYKMHREKLTKTRGGDTPVETLAQVMENYSRPIKPKEKELWEMDAAANVMRVINSYGK